MKTHRLFGLDLASDFPFANQLSEGTPGRGAPVLTFACTDRPAAPDGPGERVYRSPWRNAEGESLVHLDRYRGAEVLRLPPAAEFTLEPGRITGHLLGPDQRELLELRLIGPVLSYWLERMGIPTLHASAVRKGAGAVAFLARHGGGKSSLAAALLRAGAPLLTDDVLPVEEAGGRFFARPGYPQMRMEPDTARHFLGSVDGLAPVCPGEAKLRVPVGPDGSGFGTFQDTALPLTCLYVAERAPAGSRVEIAPFSKSHALIELVRHSFAPHLVEAAGLQPSRLDLFARLVQHVPVHRLSYPAGFEHLPRLVSMILDC